VKPERRIEWNILVAIGTLLMLATIMIAALVAQFGVEYTSLVGRTADGTQVHCLVNKVGVGFRLTAASPFAVRHDDYVAPYLLIGVAWLSLPSIWFLRRKLHGPRPRKGFCMLCGYDLRATAGQCPECGKLNLSR